MKQYYECQFFRHQLPRVKWVIRKSLPFPTKSRTRPHIIVPYQRQKKMQWHYRLPRYTGWLSILCFVHKIVKSEIHAALFVLFVFKACRLRLNYSLNAYFIIYNDDAKIWLLWSVINYSYNVCIKCHCLITKPKVPLVVHLLNLNNVKSVLIHLN